MSHKKHPLSTQLKILSKTDRANIIADVSKQFQSTKAALDAVAENLNEVEKERRKAIKVSL